MDTSNVDAVALMYAVADQIDFHPESYNQGTYQSECGSQHCIAGWALLLKTGKQWIGWSEAIERDAENCWASDYVVGEMLGLSNDEAETLFMGTWKPAGELTVGDALRKFANGASLEEISR